MANFLVHPVLNSSSSDLNELLLALLHLISCCAYTKNEVKPFYGWGPKSLNCNIQNLFCMLHLQFTIEMTGFKDASNPSRFDLFWTLRYQNRQAKQGKRWRDHRLSARRPLMVQDMLYKVSQMSQRKMMAWIRRVGLLLFIEILDLLKRIVYVVVMLPCV